MTAAADIHAQFKLAYPDFALDVDMQLPGSGITALFGPSGSGKSTLLRCIAGLEKAQGSLSINQATWQDQHIFLPTHQRPIGYVFQDATLFPHLSVKANLAYGLNRQSKQHPDFSLDSIIDLLGIRHLLDRKPAFLSGGEKQRVAITRALAVSPELLLMDEPMAALDTARKREIMPFLEKLRDQLNIPMIYVTHSTEEVIRLADHIVVVDDGKVVRSGDLNHTMAHIDSALLPDHQASVIIEASITEIDPQWHLAKADFQDGAIWVRDQHFSLNQKIRFMVLDKDVSIALKANHDSSISNVLQATVDEIGDGEHPAVCFARLKIGDTYIISRLTRRSLHSLNIKPGDTVWAQIKLVAIVE